MNRILKIYDWFSRHRKFLWLFLAGSVVVIIFLISHLKYSEDISDFLPLKPSDKEAFSIYQNISGADRLFILFDNPDDPDMVMDAMSHFEKALHEKDSLGWCRDLTVRFDMEAITEVTDFVYENIPYFLSAEDYVRIDSLLACPGYIDKRLDTCLLMPGVKSIVCVALNYAPAERMPESELQFAAYALGQDYHDIMKSRLHALAAHLNITAYRAFCDTAPVLERYWAAQAGLGWLGRNHQLIIPNAGSMFFLGELFRNLSHILFDLCH